MTDIELILLARSGDEVAFQRLYNRHKAMVIACARPYFAKGADRADIKQEALFGFHKAVRGYQPGRGGFQAFANVCIERQILTAVKSLTRHKHDPLNERLSVSKPLGRSEDGDDFTIEDTAAFADLHADPAVQKEMRDEFEAVCSTVRASLSPMEKTAILGIANGETYDEITASTGISFKQIDNAAQRARGKIASALEAA